MLLSFKNIFHKERIKKEIKRGPFLSLSKNYQNHISSIILYLQFPLHSILNLFNQNKTLFYQNYYI